jgi:hypothetical protein
MVIGIAIVVAMILYILDRNHVFPQVWRGSKRALKVSCIIALILVVAGLVTWGIFAVLGFWQETLAASRVSVTVNEPTVWGTSPSGEHGRIPANKLPEALAVGYEIGYAEKEDIFDKLARESGAIHPLPKKIVRRFGNARVAADSANLCEEERDHPGWGNPFSVITVVSFPLRVERLNGNSEWSQVRLPDGRTGYIGTSQLQMDQDIEH